MRYSFASFEVYTVWKWGKPNEFYYLAYLATFNISSTKAFSVDTIPNISFHSLLYVLLEPWKYYCFLQMSPIKPNLSLI